jgi:sec-independent protein translocase protein TatB
MFDIGWSELVVIGVVALIAIGPKELPGVLRMAGQWIGKVRRMAAEFQGQFQEALREAEMEDLKKQVNEITDSAHDLTNFDPLEHVQSELDSSFDAIRVDDPATPVETGHMAPSDYSSTSTETDQ